MAVYWRGVRLDTRTRDMMAEVARRVSWHVTPTQGSYSNYSKSAGTHSGGGAIDLSVSGLNSTQRETYVRWMRRVGFAAWLRDANHGGFSPHIHAIAIGCSDLSYAAKEQVRDYCAGRNGLANDGPDYHWRPDPIPTWETYWQAVTVARGLPDVPDTPLPDAPTPEDDLSVADVRIGIYQMLQEAADRSTPTGRQLGDFLIRAVWGNAVVHRTDGDVSVIQELADAKTAARETWRRVEPYLNSQTAENLSVSRGNRDAIANVQVALTGIKDQITALAGVVDDLIEAPVDVNVN